jgi:predicted nucleotidyltransferase component of viral defense system
MNNSIFDQMMLRYSADSKEYYSNALRETMQQIILAGLYRAGFFDIAAFYGGTCLRVFYGSQRFSEDMDFSLLQADKNFTLENYFDPIIHEFQTLGRDVIINKKEKKKQTNIESAFLKDNTAVYDVKFKSEKNVKIKIEVDIDPPTDFNTEHKLLLLPFSFMTRCYVLSDLYAGKIHAMLFRNWKNRVKGRDWYDFEWYVRNNVTLNFKHFCKRTEQFNNFSQDKKITRDHFFQLLKDRIKNTNIETVKNDVRPFIKNHKELEIWSTDYFLQLVDKIKII